MAVFHPMTLDVARQVKFVDTIYRLVLSWLFGISFQNSRNSLRFVYFSPLLFVLCDGIKVVSFLLFIVSFVLYLAWSSRR